MDWFQFISSIIDHVAWPVTVIVLLLLLRPQVALLLSTIKYLKYKDLEVAFGAGLEELEKEIPAAEIEEAEVDVSAEFGESCDQFYRIADISPNAAVLEAWVPIEAELVRISKGLDFKPRQVTARIPTMLVKKGILRQDVANAIQDLRVLRNTAAHAIDEKEININQAYQFKKFTDFVLKHLKNIDPSNT